MCCLKGHVVFVDHTWTIIYVAEILPILSSEVEILEFQRKAGTNTSGGTVVKQMKCKREKVRASLIFLKKYSPDYGKIEISLEWIEILPEDGFLTHTTVNVTE